MTNAVSVDFGNITITTRANPEIPMAIRQIARKIDTDHGVLSGAGVSFAGCADTSNSLTKSPIPTPMPATSTDASFGSCPFSTARTICCREYGFVFLPFGRITRKSGSSVMDHSVTFRELPESPTLHNDVPAENAATGGFPHLYGTSHNRPLTNRLRIPIIQPTKRAAQCGRLGGEKVAGCAPTQLTADRSPSIADCTSRLTTNGGDTQIIGPRALTQPEFICCVPHSASSVRPVCAEQLPRIKIDEMDGARAPP